MIWLVLFLLFYQYIALIKYLNFKKKKQKTKKQSDKQIKNSQNHNKKHTQSKPPSRAGGGWELRHTDDLRWKGRRHFVLQMDRLSLMTATYSNFPQKMFKKKTSHSCKITHSNPRNGIPLWMCVFAQWLSHMQLSGTPWTGACQTPPSHLLPVSRQEYCSGLPFPPPGDLPNLEIKPLFPTRAGGFLPPRHQRRLNVYALLAKEKWKTKPSCQVTSHLKNELGKKAFKSSHKKVKFYKVLTAYIERNRMQESSLVEKKIKKHKP